MTLTELTAILCGLPAPSGFEDAARDFARDYISRFCSETRTDALGNLIALKKSERPDAPRLLINAHMDEIGFIVTGCDQGFLRFACIGGVDPRVLPACRVKLLTEPPMFGVIDVLPPHVLSAEDMDKSTPADKLVIDCGLSADEAGRLVPPGTPAVFAGDCRQLREGVICGKSLDDRACVAIVLKIFEALADRALDFDLYALISTQEELGFRGATPGVFGIDPEYAIAIDVTHARTPDAQKRETMRFGGGAAITVGPNLNRSFTGAIRDYADKTGLKYQIEVEAGCTGTDAWAFQASRCGVSTALLSLPIKYMHSPVEMMLTDDAQSIVDILTGFLADFREGGAAI